MSIVANDLKFYLTGGATNTDPLLSLGGTISSTQMSQSLDAFFDAVTSAEALAGDVEYRGVRLKNTAAETAYNVVLYISSQTSSANTDYALAYDSVGTQTIANESTAPTGVTFSAPSSYATGISIGNMTAGSTVLIWFKYTVTAGAASTASDAWITATDADTI